MRRWASAPTSQKTDSLFIQLTYNMDNFSNPEISPTYPYPPAPPFPDFRASNLHNHNRTYGHPTRPPLFTHFRPINTDLSSLRPALELAFHPRSFIGHHAERQFLINQLQEADRCSTELFRQLPRLDAQKVEKGHEQLQRQGLRQRIAESVDREREILAKLGEVCVEIQCRDRWERAMMGLSPWGQREVLEPRQEVRGLSEVGLEQSEIDDDEMPSRIPPVMGGDARNWPVQNDREGWLGPGGFGEMGYAGGGGLQGMETFPTFSGGESTGQPEVAEQGEDYEADLRGGGYSDQVDTSTFTDDKAEEPTVAGRRRSMPSVQYTWSDPGDREGGGHECLGYAGDERGG
ncbi:uncharacterized protein BCR38DRAFT_485880 [Pseudomassariella vexata]|uniref:Uncharacterized protein n=1 Tax=Pseudomassariella vexata TaxID=1141098 RepID=A0A1Y2DUZ8_9PEZI|nr:uncharacterized protein BCR38DRAFT_485880 [Pseudomassariella vexata]ORY63110.1 hypothetical protein BCR38DRAFT_485880 [Pseudomassariella vexata]